MIRRSLCALALALASCGPGEGVIRLTVGATGRLDGVVSLRILTANDGQLGEPVSLDLPGAPLTIPPAQRVALRFPRSRKGAVVLTVEALDGKKQLLARGQTSGELKQSQVVDLSLTLTGGPAPTDGGSSDGGSDGGAPGWVPSAGVPTMNDLRGIWAASPTNLFIACAGGTILHTTNGGMTWFTEVSGVGVDLNRIWGSGPGDIYIVGDIGTILHSTDNGKSWVKQGDGGTDKMNDVWGAAPTDVYAVGAGGTILHTADGGKRWTRDPSGTMSALHGLWGSGPGDLYAVGKNGVILHHDGRTREGGADGGVDGGGAPERIWTLQSSGITSSLDTVSGSGKSDVWAVGDMARMLHTVDGGATWRVEAVPTPFDLEYIAAAPGGSLYAIGQNGVILSAPPGGGKWTVESSGTQVKLYGALILPGDVFVIGQAGLLLKRR